MPRLILPPDWDRIKRWGPLGWVSEEERVSIMALPPVQHRYELERLEKEIAAFKKRRGGR